MTGCLPAATEQLQFCVAGFKNHPPAISLCPLSAKSGGAKADKTKIVSPNDVFLSMVLPLVLIASIADNASADGIRLIGDHFTRVVFSIPSHDRFFVDRHSTESAHHEPVAVEYFDSHVARSRCRQPDLIRPPNHGVKEGWRRRDHQLDGRLASAGGWCQEGSERQQGSYCNCPSQHVTRPP